MSHLAAESSPPQEAPAEVAWQPLPPRARMVFLIGTIPGFALIGIVTGALMGGIGNGLIAPMAGAAAGLVVGALFGAWLGLKHYRHTFWRLDEDGLAVRRGRLWQRETRVPATRVQHLDIKRGPLQRGRQLATLVVHTAGTRHSAVSIPNLDETDAERLRDRLSVQIDHDDQL